MRMQAIRNANPAQKMTRGARKFTGRMEGSDTVGNGVDYIGQMNSC